jgi:hypothetical protein
LFVSIGGKVSLYQCEKCGCCENTALGCYWGRERKLCSECGTGKWHGEFDKVLLPKGQFVTNDEGNLAHRETGDTDFLKYALEPNADGIAAP